MRAIETLARAYLDSQQTRIGLEGRIRKLLESWLPHKTEVVDLNDGRKPRTVHHVLCPEDNTEMTLDVDGEKAKCEQNHAFTISELLEKQQIKPQDKEIFQVLMSYRSRLKNEEKAMLHDASLIVRKHPIFDYCEAVKGLGPVAGMTFLGYVDPAKCVSAGKMFAYLGLVPKMKLESGKQAHWNPELRGRFWMLGRNVIMARDPYYYPLYKVKKEYYATRPDIVALKDTKRGWKGWVDNMARRWVLKLIISHALQVIREAEGYDVSNLKSHRNYIAPPPYSSHIPQSEPNPEENLPRERAK